LSSLFAFNLPFCLHIPDGEYVVKLSYNDAVALRLKKIVPKSYDERMRYRGFVDSDLHDICEVGITSLEQSDEQAKNRSRLVEPEDLSEIGEFCRVIHVKDKNGKTKIAGSPLPVGDSSHENFLTDKEIYLNAEIKKDRLGRLRYTRVEITSSSSDYPFPKVLLAVNKLIDAYRIVSKEYWLGRISEQDILFTTETALDGSSVGAAHMGMAKTEPDVNREDINRLVELITSTCPASTSDLLMLDAQKALDEENNALAVVYSITALESVAKQYVRRMAKRKGWSEEKFVKLNLATLVNVILRIVFSKDELSDDLMKNFVSANKLRNKIIHEATISVHKEEANKAFKTAQELINKLALN
jgi:hypothetical protein